MYCDHCGARMGDEAIFCGTCGARRFDDPAPRRYFASSPGDVLVAPQPGAVDRPPYAGGRIDWTLRDVLFGVLWFLGLFLILPIPIAAPFLVYGDDSTQYYAAALVAGSISELGLIAVAAYLTFRQYGGGWARLGVQAPSWQTLGYALAAVVGALILAYIYGAIIELFDIDWLRAERDDQLPDTVLDNATLLAIAGVVTIGVAPVCEEIFFRGFMLPGMSRAWGIAVAVIGSAAVFSIAHIGPNIHKTLIPIFIIGAVFGFTYYRSGNILSTIGAHLLFNTISFLGLALSDPDDAAAVAMMLRSLVLMGACV
jgi:membrane protease YdiL (CAAX protease family)